ncbi:MAG: RidA family protein [Flavobacteriales bacterium]|jgi:2-aminomuconate deaminase|nr:RidA family protein [Flavobacteriales bacterium]
MDNTLHNAQGAPKAVGLYPHARKVGNLLFLSGVGPRVAGSDANDSGVPGLKRDAMGNFEEFDFEAQVHAVFANVRVILESAGSDWENLVDVTVFLVNMQRDFKTFNRLYAEYFKDAQPCRTTVEVNSLPTPIAIELKCIATIGERPSSVEL